MCGFLLVPVVGVILAKTVVGAFTYRYALPGVIALSIIIAWGLDPASDGRPILGLTAAMVLCGVFIAKEVQTYGAALEGRAGRAMAYTLFESRAKGSATIVLANPEDFFELSFHPHRFA